jgi:hypothetical protein
MHKLHTDIEPKQKEAISSYVKTAVWASRWPVRNGAPRMRNVGNRCKWVDRFTSRPLCLQRKNPHHPLHKRQAASLSQSVSFGEISFTPTTNLTTILRTHNSDPKPPFHILAPSVIHGVPCQNVSALFLWYRVLSSAEIRKHQLSQRISYPQVLEALNSSRGIVTGSLAACG